MSLLKISADLNLEDFRALQDSVTGAAKRRGGMRRVLGVIANIVLWIFLTVVFLFVLEYFRNEKVDITDFLAGAFFVIIATFGFFLLFWYAYRRSLAPSLGGPILGKRNFIFNNSGISEETKCVQSSASWRGVQNIVETKEHVFFMVDTIAGFIVPKRSIGNDGEVREFLGDVESLRNSGG